jgi:hypothetical protein
MGLDEVGFSQMMSKDEVERIRPVSRQLPISWVDRLVSHLNGLCPKVQGF